MTLRTGLGALKKKLTVLFQIKLLFTIEILWLFHIISCLTTPPSFFFDTDDSSHNGNEIKMLGALDITGNRIAKDLRNGVELSQTYDIVNGRAQLPVYMTSNHGTLSMKLEDDIDKMLQGFKESQELLYRAVEQKLYSQKDYLLSLYRQLDSERSALANPMPLPYGGDYDNLLASVLERVDQIRHEEENLGNMMKIVKGFGQMHKTINGGHFGFAIDDRTKSGEYL